MAIKANKISADGFVKPGVISEPFGTGPILLILKTWRAWIQIQVVIGTAKGSF